MAKADWVACPHCGEEIPRNAKACRHCGSDERTGWSEDTYLDGLGLPEPEDYSEGLESEGFQKSPVDGKRLAMGAVALALVALFGLWLIRQAGF